MEVSIHLDDLFERLIDLKRYRLDGVAIVWSSTLGPVETRHHPYPAEEVSYTNRTIERTRGESSCASNTSDVVNAPNLELDAGGE